MLPNSSSQTDSREFLSVILKQLREMPCIQIFLPCVKQEKENKEFGTLSHLYQTGLEYKFHVNVECAVSDIKN